MHIIPDDKQEEPSPRLHQAPTGAQLTLRHTTALNPDKAQRTISNFYATTRQEWLKTRHDQIAAHTTNQPLTGSFSTRMRTIWARNHPTRGLTLHWATAELPPTLLRELIRRTLNLPTIASNHDLNNALRRLWLGRLTTPDPHPPPLPTNTRRPPHQPQGRTAAVTPPRTTAYRPGLEKHWYAIWAVTYYEAADNGLGPSPSGRCWITELEAHPRTSNRTVGH
ncbi:DUF45 domain-containing protein [Streptomyces sp. G44]|nr:DUF45 domain-containing protein [Streptomyces sp. G44]